MVFFGKGDLPCELTINSKLDPFDQFFGLVMTYCCSIYCHFSKILCSGRLFADLGVGLITTWQGCSFDHGSSGAFCFIFSCNGTALRWHKELSQPITTTSVTISRVSTVFKLLSDRSKDSYTLYSSLLLFALLLHVLQQLSRPMETIQLLLLTLVIGLDLIKCNYPTGVTTIINNIYLFCFELRLLLVSLANHRSDMQER